MAKRDRKLLRVAKRICKALIKGRKPEWLDPEIIIALYGFSRNNN